MRIIFIFLCLASFLAAFFAFPLVGPEAVPVPYGHEGQSFRGQWRIEVPSIGIDVPMITKVDGGNRDEYMHALESGVAHMKETALPGFGNSVVFGHSSGYPWSVGKHDTAFARIGELGNGSEIIARSGEYEARFSVFSRKIVDPDDVQSIFPKEDGVLVLISCWPVGTNEKRMIVLARQLR